MIREKIESRIEEKNMRRTKIIDNRTEGGGGPRKDD